MSYHLSDKERRYLEDFIKSASVRQLSSTFSYSYASAISFVGLILFASMVIILVDNLKDGIVYYVFLPGIIGGVGIILLGIILMKYFKRVEEKRKLAEIIGKLLKSGEESKP